MLRLMREERQQAELRMAQVSEAEGRRGRQINIDESLRAADWHLTKRPVRPQAALRESESRIAQAKQAAEAQQQIAEHKCAQQLIRASFTPRSHLVRIWFAALT